MTKLLCPLLLLACICAHADERNWHVLIVTNDGKVSLLKGLTKSEAEHTAAKLRGVAYTREEKAAAAKAAAEEQKRRAAITADIEKRVRAAKVQCPDLSTDGIGERWDGDYWQEGCIRPDGSFQLLYWRNLSGESAPRYKQIEVFE